MLATCPVVSNVATCNSIVNALVDQGGTNTFYIHVNTDASTSAYTTSNDTLTISISNLDTDIGVSSSESNGTTIVGPNTGLFLSSSIGPSVTVNE